MSGQPDKRCRSDGKITPMTRPTRPTLPARAHLLLGLLLSTVSILTWSQSVREQEQASCLPGEISTWPDGVDQPMATGRLRLVYRHDGAPPGLSEAQVLGAVQRAAQAWSACDIPVEVISEAAAAIEPASVARVQWSEAAARGQPGLANQATRTLSLAPGIFARLAARQPPAPAFQILQMIISHEMGHFMGLRAHSRRCIDVMSYYKDDKGQVCSTRDGRPYTAVPEYRALLPTACDIARCKAINARR